MRPGFSELWFGEAEDLIARLEISAKNLERFHDVVIAHHDSFLDADSLSTLCVDEGSDCMVKVEVNLACSEYQQITCTSKNIESHTS